MIWYPFDMRDPVERALREFHRRGRWDETTEAICALMEEHADRKVKEALEAAAVEHQLELDYQGAVQSEVARRAG